MEPLKERRRFIGKLGSVTALLAMSSGMNRIKGISGSIIPVGSGNIGGPFVHTVFFWLVDESPGTDERFRSELFKFIDNVDLIKTMHVGKPADTNREVIDNSYSYCMILTFDSKAEHDLYQEHTLHKRFIENASELWNKVLVYDSVRC